MNITTLLDMAVSAAPERIAFGPLDDGLTYSMLRDEADAGATAMRAIGVRRLLLLSGNGVHVPTTLFAAAAAGVEFVPLSHRLGDEQLSTLLAGQPEGTLLLCEDRFRSRTGAHTGPVLDLAEWDARRAATDAERVEPADPAGDGPAVLLYTSGTSAAPKAAVLRHRHLSAYILGTVEFGGADEDDAALVTVPPYHIAGLSAVLSNVYAQRRVVYLDHFTPAEWLDAATREGATNCMLVPTMLARIVAHLDSVPAISAPPVRTLAYGGARTPMPVLERALELFPDTAFVNAYGLTETSSTIAVLGPEDHREAARSEDPRIRSRLLSAGRPVPGLEVSIRTEAGAPVAPGGTGELWVRGPQVSGEYDGRAGSLDADGWFPTKDLARLDDDGYLFVEGRMDDTIIRGGENIAPAEIEDVVLRHPGVAECAVVGVPDLEWGQRIVAVVVPVGGSEIDVAQLRERLTERLRSSRSPDDVVVWSELPQTDTGKVQRRRILDLLADAGIAVTGAPGTAR